MKKKISLLLVFVMLVSMLAACGKGNGSNGSYDVAKAKEYVKSLYKKTDGVTKANDYEVVGNVKIAGDDYKVEWTVEVTSGNKDDVKLVAKDGKYTVDINEKASEAATYVLKATITAPDGSKDTYELTHKLAAFKQFSWADYVAAEKDSNVVVTGIVTGIISKTKGASSNCVYFQDKDGGYYAYQTSLDPVADLDIKPGYTITCSGIKDLYSGTHEVKSGVIEITDKTTKLPEAVDYTTIFTNAASLKDATLVEKQALLVTLKGVEITGQGSDATYYNFKLGDKISYVRISSSTCPLSKDEQKQFTETYLANIGNKCDVTGLITLYDGAFYLTPITVDAFHNYVTVEKTDAEKVAYEAEKLGIPAKVQKDTVLDLAATGSLYKDVAITYTVEGATYADGKLTLVQGDKDAVVKVTATIKAGTETKEVVVEIKVEAKAADMSVAEVLNKLFALESGESLAGIHVLQGTITEFAYAYDAEKNNCSVWLDVQGKKIEAYKLVGGADLAVGDVITVTGVLKRYKDTYEFDGGCTYSKTLSVEEAKQLVVLDKLFALESGESLPGKYVLQGTITEFAYAYDAEKNNCSVWLDINGKKVEAYKLVGGADLAVGDKITVTGVLKRYKDTYEFDGGCTYAKDQSLEDAKAALILEQLFALESGESITGLQTLTGKITEFAYAYDAEKNNCSVWLDIQGKKVEAYKLVGGADLAVGDEITVTGILKRYKDTYEFDSNCTYTK